MGIVTAPRLNPELPPSNLTSIGMKSTSIVIETEPTQNRQCMTDRKPSRIANARA
jgi:hypothetical protein